LVLNWGYFLNLIASTHNIHLLPFNIALEQSSNEIASFNELEGFYTHLAQVLEHIDYFEEKRPKALLM
jgi:tRNA C32,U32 (ribose-2'-O)-methylase TrmJ